MFNDPGWASKEEWDAYDWFGFALSEAQTVEMLLQVLATALHMDSLQGTEKRDHWPRLYDSFGRLTLGTLLMRVRSHKKLQLSESLLQSLAHVRDLRNRLVHGFLRPTDSPLSDVERLADATRELQMAASLFRNSVPELERTVYTALDQLRVTRAEVEEQISTRPAEIG